MSKRVWPAWAGWFVLALALYASTASRGAQWQDSGYFILRTIRGELMNPLGLALTHPLHYWICRFAIRVPGLEPAYAITLVSALAAAVAVANLYGCVVTLTGRPRAAALAAASLLVANTFWQLATVVETYTLAAAFLTSQCWCVILLVQSATGMGEQAETAGDARTPVTSRWIFLAMCTLNGLSFANHNLALLTLPMLAVTSVWALRKGVISIPLTVIGMVVWLVGASPHLVLIVREATSSGDLLATIRSVLFGTAFEARVLSTSLSGRLLLISMGFVLLNFPNLLLPAAVSGLWQALRRTQRPALARILLVGLAVHSLFAFRYPVPDQHYFFLSTYVFLCLFGGIGFARWMGDPAYVGKKLLATAWFLILVTPMLYALVPVLARKIDTLGYVERNKPYRDDYVYLFVPWSFVERSAARLSQQAADMADESGAIIVEDGMAQFAVRYELDRRGHNGVEVYVPEMPPKAMEAAMEAGRKVVLVPRDADHPTTLPLRGTWKRHGDLYELQPDSNGD